MRKQQQFQKPMHVLGRNWKTLLVGGSLLITIGVSAQSASADPASKAKVTAPVAPPPENARKRPPAIADGPGFITPNPSLIAAANKPGFFTFGVTPDSEVVKEEGRLYQKGHAEISIKFADAKDELGRAYYRDHPILAFGANLPNNIADLLIANKIDVSRNGGPFQPVTSNDITPNVLTGKQFFIQPVNGVEDLLSKTIEFSFDFTISNPTENMLDRIRSESASSGIQSISLGSQPQLTEVHRATMPSDLSLLSCLSEIKQLDVDGRIIPTNSHVQGGSSVREIDAAVAQSTLKPGQHSECDSVSIRTGINFMQRGQSALAFGGKVAGSPIYHAEIATEVFDSSRNKWQSLMLDGMNVVKNPNASQIIRGTNQDLFFPLINFGPVHFDYKVPALANSGDKGVGRLNSQSIYAGSGDTVPNFFVVVRAGGESYHIINLDSRFMKFEVTRRK